MFSSADQSVEQSLSAWLATANDCGMMHYCAAEDYFCTQQQKDQAPITFEKGQCGIYFWTTEMGESYIGQSKDIRSRLRQHFKNHRDILFAAFVLAPPEDLDTLERQLIEKVEKKHRLRNIKLVQSSSQTLPLDSIMSRQEQDGFLKEGNLASWLDMPRREMPIIQARSRSKRANFIAMQALYQPMLGLLNDYISKTIPIPSLTEQRFWSITWLTDGFLRLNVGQQETLTLEYIPELDDFEARFICPQALAKDWEQSSYQTRDIISFAMSKEALRIVKQSKSLEAMRMRNLHLARHTTPLNIQSHCPWLWQNGQFKPKMGWLPWL